MILFLNASVIDGLEIKTSEKEKEYDLWLPSPNESVKSALLNQSYGSSREGRKSLHSVLSSRYFVEATSRTGGLCRCSGASLSRGFEAEDTSQLGSY